MSTRIRFIDGAISSGVRYDIINYSAGSGSERVRSSRHQRLVQVSRKPIQLHESERENVFALVSGCVRCSRLIYFRRCGEMARPSIPLCALDFYVLFRSVSSFSFAPRMNVLVVLLFRFFLSLFCSARKIHTTQVPRRSRSYSRIAMAND